VKRLFPLLFVLTLVNAGFASAWDEVESLSTNGYTYVEGLDPFAKQIIFDRTSIQIGKFGPESLRWGEQRNLGKDYSEGLFSERPDLGLGGGNRTETNYTPRLMPFGGPLAYGQGRDFSFTFDESREIEFEDAGFLEFYQHAIPFYKSSGEVEVSYGEFGSLTSRLTTTVPSDVSQIALDVSWKEFGDYRDGNQVLLTDSLDLENPKERYIDEATGRDIYRMRQIESNGKYNFSKTQYVEFEGKFSDNQGVYFPELRMDAEYDRGSNVSAVYHVQNPSASVQKLSVRAFSSNAQQELNDRWRVSRERSIEADLNQDYSTKANSRSNTQGIDFKAVKDFSDSQIGFGMRRYWQEWDATSETLGIVNDMLPTVSQSNFGAYLEGRRYLGNFLLSGAIRIDQLDTEVDGNIGFIRRYRTSVERRIQDSALSASARLNYAINDKSSIYMELSHSSRAPDPNEMFVQYQYERAPGNELIWLGNPELESVKNTSLHSGFSLDMKRVKIDVSAFYARVQDMIYLENITPAIDQAGFLGTAISYNNIDANLWGGEASMQVNLADSLVFTGAVELIRGEKTTLDGLSGDRDLAELPPLSARLALEYDDKAWFGKFELRMAEAQLNVDESLSESPLDGYTVLNTLIGYYITENLLITIGVENITDQAYATRNVNIRNPFTRYGLSNEPGRFIYVSFKWGF
jgi:iron complex outermembrane receptor protein